MMKAKAQTATKGMEMEDTKRPILFVITENVFLRSET